MTKSKSSAKSSKEASQKAISTEIPHKPSHNLLGLLTKPGTIDTFDSILDMLNASKYKTLLTVDAPIYLQTQREFWKNCILEKQGEDIIAINSTLQKKAVRITPQSISEVFQLNDLQGKDSFPKNELNIDFIERGYADTMMKRDTLEKGFFPSTTRFLFHTLLMCVSNKTTSFNEIPMKIQNLGYAILQGENLNYSKEIFNDLVKNVETKSFLLFPRLLSYYFEKKFSKDDIAVINQGESFQINNLTTETFSRMLTPCKTRAEVPEQNLAATTAPHVSAAEPTAQGDQGSQTTVLEPTPKITKKPQKKKTQKPTKPIKKATLEDEIPEQLPVIAQKSQQTTVATSSQQLVEISQPIPETPPVSSQKEQVVQTGSPHHDALEALVSNIHCSMPGAIPSSIPSITSPIPPNTKLLLDAIDLNLAQTGPSQSPVHEKIPQQETELDVSIFANPPTQPEEVTPLELQVTLGGIPSEAATTSVEPTGLHLDSGYINKTSLEAIPFIAPLPTTSGFVYPTGNIKRLSSVEGRRPRYQEKRASVVHVWSTLPTSTIDKTIVSGKSDDPIKLGDDLKYQDLTARIEKLDTSVVNLKNMLQQVLKTQKMQSTVVPPQAPALQQALATNELWNLFQPFLHHQAQFADQQHEKHVQQLRHTMESRFKNTQADLKALKTQIMHTTGTAPPTVLFIDKLPPDNAKKGEKIQEWKKKGIEDEVVASVKRDREAKRKARVDYPDQGTSGSKDDENLIDEKKKPTRRVRLPKSITIRRSKSVPKTPPKTVVVTPAVTTTVGTSVVSTSAPTSTHTTSTHTTSTALSPSPPKTKSPPAKRQKTAAVITSAVKTIVVGTPVVSTTVSLPQTTATTSTTTVPFKTSSAPPQTKKRRLIHKDDDTSPSQTSSKSLALVTIPKPVTLSSVQMQKPLPPAGVQFPLELAAVREEINLFTMRMTLPKGIKAKQAEDISKRNTQGKSDKEISRNYQYLLTQVSSLERFAKNVSQQISERAAETLKNDYIESIMAHKKYKGERYMYKEWTVPELENEAARIQDIIKRKVTHTPPDWAKFKKNVPDKQVELKRMKEELVAADFGNKRQIARWKEDVVRTTYKRLEELRKKDPNVPQKPDYPEAEVSKRPSKLQIRRATAPTGTTIYKRRIHKQLKGETIQEMMKGDDLVKEGIKKMIIKSLGLGQTANTAQPVMNRPASPNTSANKHLPRNPPGSKIQKWETDKQTCVLTLLRSGGEVEKISREQALGLSLEDLQDLLNLPLSRDDEDTDALDFEL
ncbi:hypothetical protein Hanom_Chr12g01123151 [Helianthus anomalus]